MNIHIFVSGKEKAPMAENRISHDGVVDSQKENEVVVRITSYASCHDCHARAVCNVAEEKEKFLRVKSVSERFRTGDKVRVVLAQALGFRALFLGYVLPFLLVLAALLIATASGCSELVAGGISLSVLPPYYLGLKLFRGRLDRQFSFIIEKP